MRKCDITDNDCSASKRIPRLLKWAQRILLTSGLSLLAVYGVIRLEGWTASRAALKSFEALESPAPAAQRSPEEEKGASATAKESGATLAVLRIPKIHLAVPLLDGTDGWTLNHAVGRIRGTAWPGEQGNLGIAGHRDSFFRGLKDMRIGDVIELETVEGTDTYVVEKTEIVKPDNVGVLKPQHVPSLTLITCYPFYFVGSAPKRFVVKANLRPALQTSSTTQEEK